MLARVTIVPFLPRDAILARYMLSSCVCPSICLTVSLSVASPHCTKMAKRMITQTTPCDSARILVFGRNSNGVKGQRSKVKVTWSVWRRSLMIVMIVSWCLSCVSAVTDRATSTASRLVWWRAAVGPAASTRRTGVIDVWDRRRQDRASCPSTAALHRAGTPRSGDRYVSRPARHSVYSREQFQRRLNGISVWELVDHDAL